MIRHSLLMAAAAAGMALLPSVADAAPARIVGNVNLRTGPGAEYYRIMTLPPGAPVEVYGCLQGYTWCDVSYGDLRGWVSSRYLSMFYSGNAYYPARPAVVVPFLSFNFGYWDDHYRNRPWYAQRPRPPQGWNPPPPNWNPPPPNWHQPPNWGPRTNWGPPMNPQPPRNWGPQPRNWNPPDNPPRNWNPPSNQPPRNWNPPNNQPPRNWNPPNNQPPNNFGPKTNWGPRPGGNDRPPINAGNMFGPQGGGKLGEQPRRGGGDTQLCRMINGVCVPQ